MTTKAFQRQCADLLDQLSTERLTPNEVATKVAQELLDIRTLETQNSDSLDFHELSVWGLRAALEVAFRAGMAHGQG